MNYEEGFNQIENLMYSYDYHLTKEFTEALFEDQSLKDRKYHKTTTASFPDICDHLKVNFVERENDDRSIEITEEQVSEDPSSKDIFKPQKGEMVTVINLPSDPTIAELAELVGTIRSLSNSPMLEGQDKEQIMNWIERTREYSLNLREAGIAMAYVSKLALETRNVIPILSNIDNIPYANTSSMNERQFDELYYKSAEIIYQLGLAIGIDQIDNVNNATLFEALEELQEDNNNDPNKIKEDISKGIQYARFGENTKRENYTINDALRLYERLRSNPDSWRLLGYKEGNKNFEGIIGSVVNKAIPIHVKNKQQIGSKIEQLPRDTIEALFHRGQEIMYQELGVPDNIKKLVSLDLDQLSDLEILELLKDFDFAKALAISQFDVVSNRQWIDYEENTQNPSLHGFYKDKPTNARKFLQEYQEDLQTLGLGKENITKFSEWFEDPEFFDDKKKKLLFKSSKFSEQDKDYWDDSIKSIDDALEYYKKLSTREGIDAYAHWQQAMTELIIDEMRINYGGWFDEKFSSLQDSSPSKIISREQFNCAGRTTLLMRTLKKIGVQTYSATEFCHIATFGKFANNFEYLIEASINKGNELRFVNSVKDRNHIFNPDERIVETERLTYESLVRERYLVTPHSNVALEVFVNYKNDLPSRSNLLRIGNLTSSTTIFNVFAYRQEGFLSNDEIDKIIRKLQILEPDYLNMVGENNLPQETINRMKKYWNRALEKYGEIY